MSAVRVLKLQDVDQAQLQRLFRRDHLVSTAVKDQCRRIIEAVREKGDAALLAFTAEFDGVQLPSAPLRVSDQQFEDAALGLSTDLKNALEQAILNIRRVHEAQLPPEFGLLPVDAGTWVGHRWSPIDSVCLYVPRGRGSFSSVACMLGVPARLAAVPRIILCTPPGPNGEVDGATLFVARLLGIDEVYRVGGAQAVAAVAFGTQTIPRCDKVIGPGNVYVAAARQELSHLIDPGPPAGPSESLILCDESADVENAAWNLLIEAEHGENSTAVLVTHLTTFAHAVAEAAQRMIGLLTSVRRAFASEVLSRQGGIVISSSLSESIAFANRFAAEHVALMVGDPWPILPLLTNAGEILFGSYPVIGLGNYAMGINAILPTGGRARSASGVSVYDFLKRTSLGFVTKEGFDRLKGMVSVLSRHEGFSAHHEAVERWRV